MNLPSKAAILIILGLSIALLIVLFKLAVFVRNVWRLIRNGL